MDHPSHDLLQQSSMAFSHAKLMRCPCSGLSDGGAMDGKQMADLALVVHSLVCHKVSGPPAQDSQEVLRASAQALELGVPPPATRTAT